MGSFIFLFDSWMLCNSICESLRLLAHSKFQLRKTLSAQAKQISVCFVFAQISVFAFRFSSRRTSSCDRLVASPASFMCTLLLSPFPIVSVAVWITVFTRFGHCLNLFQTFYLLPFLASVSRPQVPFDFR